MSILSVNALLQLKQFFEEHNLTDSIFLAVGKDQVPDLQYISLEGLGRTHAQVVRKSILNKEDPQKYGWVSKYHYTFFVQDNCFLFLFGEAADYPKEKLDEFVNLLVKFHYNEEFV
jgi:hypothetical protein